jgi:hypothetical protein
MKVSEYLVFQAGDPLRRIEFVLDEDEEMG